MTYSNYTFTDHIGVTIFVHKWIPDSISPKALVYLAHGMAEHAMRYDFFAEALANAGYAVYADDHRGHGKSMEEGKVGSLYEDGWDGVVEDIKQITDTMKKDYPNLPLFIFGHSWGSFLTQDYMQKYPNEAKAIILSGTMGEQATLGLLIFIGKVIVAFKGRDSEAGLIYKLAIGPLNKPFAHEGSENCWISSLKEEVEKYDADTLCGFKPPNGYYMEMGLAFKRIWKKENESKINKDTPIYMLSGSDDMVSQRTKTVVSLAERYIKLGVKEVTYKFYPGARHEPINDISREEMIADCITWLDAHL
jgi:alpha-beta hydrolase superfamily lysophospholipase